MPTGLHPTPSSIVVDADAVRQQQRGLALSTASWARPPIGHFARPRTAWAPYIDLPAAPPLAGDDVATLQAKLQDLGFYAGRVDGFFGPQTHESLVFPA